MATFTTRPEITGQRGEVTAGHYLASMAGWQMLAAGGNAIVAEQGLLPAGASPRHVTRCAVGW